jgi:UrcA family protein
MSKIQGRKKPISRARKPPRRKWLGTGIIVPCLVSVMASTAGHAGTVGAEATEIHVRYHRQDLTSPVAARQLLARIEDAALEVCGASPFSLADVKSATRNSRCWRDAVDGATRQIGNPTLSPSACDHQR